MLSARICRLHVLGGGVGEIESTDDLLLVVLLLGGDVGIDQHHVVGQDLPRQRVLVEHQVDRLLDRNVLHENGGLAVALHVLVENEIDAGLARQHLEHHLGGRVAQLQGDLVVVTGLEPRRHRDGPARGGDLGGQILCRTVTGALVQHGAQLRFRGVVILALEVLAGLRDNVTVTRVACQTRKAALRAVVIGIDGEDALVVLRRGIELVRRACGVGQRNQLLDRRLAARPQIEPVSHVVRVAVRRLAEQRHPALVFPALDGRQPVAMQPLGRAAGHQNQNQNQPRNAAP